MNVELKSIILTEDVKYVGDGEDPNEDPFFQCWKQALQSINEEKAELQKQDSNLRPMD